MDLEMNVTDELNVDNVLDFLQFCRDENKSFKKDFSNFLVSTFSKSFLLSQNTKKIYHQIYEMNSFYFPYNQDTQIIYAYFLSLDTKIKRIFLNPIKEKISNFVYNQPRRETFRKLLSILNNMQIFDETQTDEGKVVFDKEHEIFDFAIKESEGGYSYFITEAFDQLLSKDQVISYIINDFAKHHEVFNSKDSQRLMQDYVVRREAAYSSICD